MVVPLRRELGWSEVTKGRFADYVKVLDAYRDHPFRRVQFRLSHEHSALQISDILIGAIAYRLNRHYDSPTANSDKKLLCDYVIQKAGFSKYIGERSFKPKKFGSCQLWYRGGEAPPPTPGKPVTGVSRVPTR